MFKIAVFISGRGSNLKSLIDYFKSKEKSVEISLVVSNKKDALGLETAKNNGIETFILDKNLDSGNNFEKLSEIIVNKQVNLIVLAGFLKKIPESFIKKFDKKIINIHPALLPSFGGEGMYGLNVHKSVFAKSCQISGVTVHYVNENYDDGLIIAQEAVDITNVKSAEEIAEKVLKVEHKLLPKVVELFSENKIEIINDRVYIKRESV